ncbi:MAG: argininosuccinate synthase [Phycisphaerales bacterium]|nr:argininosuccinate synthase [Planctomycetota bacterium]MCH8507837.1 argininosuccinate synthase [Phycisphaerales bacterium]
MSSKKTVVLAFSGGLDTSFCVPYLIEKGYEVITLFVDTGGVGPGGPERIAARAKELGAIEHVTIDAAQALWDSFVTPFVMGGVKYEDRYPLLCSDRYVIVAESVHLAHERGADAIAHGCTAMGNDQVRFDQSIRSLTDLPILAPIRDIQAITKSPRAYEIEELRMRGFEVSAEAKRYTINENLLGVTVSGAEIDAFGAPGEGTRKLTKPPAQWSKSPLKVAIGFERGRIVSLDGVPTDGPAILQTLNDKFGAYGVGRGIYTGDTIVGLKGRIVFECPGLEALLVAHKALEELTLTKAQNEFKPGVARRWTELVFGGMFYEPLRDDLEAFIRSTQATVTGEVVVETSGGVCDPVEIRTENALVRAGATYAQHADWSANDAEGFIKIHGQSAALGAAVRSKLGITREVEVCSAVS